MFLSTQQQQAGEKTEIELVAIDSNLWIEEEEAKKNNDIELMYMYIFDKDSDV